jgi:hypothetical protein
MLWTQELARFQVFSYKQPRGPPLYGETRTIRFVNKHFTELANLSLDGPIG